MTQTIPNTPLQESNQNIARNFTSWVSSWSQPWNG